jgi:hypothetical protein
LRSHQNRKGAEVGFARETRRRNLRRISQAKSERVKRTWIPTTDLLGEIREDVRDKRKRWVDSKRLLTGLVHFHEFLIQAFGRNFASSSGTGTTLGTGKIFSVLAKGDAS